MFKLPLREVEAQFTKSEIAMFSWRSQEQYWNFKRRMNKHEQPVDDPYLDEIETDEPEDIFDPAEGEDGFYSNVGSQAEGFDVDKIYANIDKQYAKKKGYSLNKVDRALDGKLPKQKEKVVGRRKQYSGNVPAGLPAKFYDPKTGEIDLRKVTGDDARKYFSALGIPLPVMNRY